jgi:multicomponent Na+:H+ antiporter subunit B
MVYSQNEPGGQIMKGVLLMILIVCVGVLLYALAAAESEPQSAVKEEIIEQATGDTGALNLVTSIYLGYRAFDTLGETIVLVLAVSGVSLLFVRES